VQQKDMWMTQSSNLQKKILSIITITALIGIFISFIISIVYNYQMKQKIYIDTKNNLIEDIDKKIYDKKLVLLSSAMALSTNPIIINALKNDQREPLIWLFRKNQRMLQNSTNYKSIKYHVMTKDGYSFFRNWKAHMYGDDLKGFKYSVKDLIKNKKPIVTIDNGKFGIFLNAIVPIFDKDGEYIGSIEAKGSFDSLAKDLKKENKSFITLMDAKYLKIKRKKDLSYVDKYIISQKTIDNNFLKRIKQLDFKTLLTNNYIKMDESFYTYKTIKNFAKQDIGIYLISEPNEIIEQVIDKNSQLAYILMGTTIIIFILIGIMMNNALQKHILVPLSSLQTGLLDFFEYLRGNKKDIKLIKIKSHDEIGNMSQSINDNITKLQSDIKKDKSMIKDLIECVKKVEDGELTNRIKNTPSKEELLEVKNFFNQMMIILEKNIGKNINLILNNLQAYSNQNYSQKIDNPKGKIEVSLNQLSNTISEMLEENSNNGENLQEKSNRLFKSIEILDSNANDQKDIIEKTTSNLEQLLNSLKRQSDNAKNMQTLSENLTSSAKSGSILAGNTITAMDEINSKVADIDKTIKIIDDIVLQTNILSLNASVEASTAGEAGKGFAVVANEVRTLASKSQDASNMIKEIVKLTQQKAEDGKTIISKMTSGYEELQQNIDQTVKLIQKSIDLTNNQEREIDEISNSTATLTKQADENKTAIENSVTIAKQTNNMAKDLVQKEIISS
jgi:methyl-accepting chemotaxis protein